MKFKTCNFTKNSQFYTNWFIFVGRNLKINDSLLCHKRQVCHWKKNKENKQTCESYLSSSKTEIFPITTDRFKFLSTNCDDFSVFDVQLPFASIDQHEINLISHPFSLIFYLVSPLFGMKISFVLLWKKN